MGAIAIRKLSLDLQASGIREGEALKARILAQARRDVARGLAAAWPLPDNEECLHIRRLSVDLTAIGELPVEHIGEELGRRIARALLALRMNPDADIVLHESPAARSAAQIAALVNGDPLDRWWLAALEGVKLLPRPRAVVTLLGRDPEAFAPIMRALPPATRDRLMAFLAPEEIKGWLASVIETGREASAFLPRLVALAQRLTRVETSAPVYALRLMIEAATQGVEAAPGALAAAANLVAAAIFASSPTASRRQPGSARGFERRLARASPLPEAAQAQIAWLSPPERATLEALSRPARAAVPPEAEAVAMSTPYANIALIWPFVDALALDRLHGGHAPPRCLPHGFATLLVLATIMGPDHAAALFEDAGWQAALGLNAVGRQAARRALARAEAPGHLRVSGFRARRLDARERAWLEGGATALVGPALAPRLVSAARVALRMMARRLPGFDGASAPFLVANLLTGAGTLSLAPGRIAVTLHAPPLDILLSITRLGDRETDLADGRRLVLMRGRTP